MIQKVFATESHVQWQTSDDLVEPALLIENTEHGYISIQQEDRYVLINKQSLPELIKHLKTLK